MTGADASISEVLAHLVADSSWADLAGQRHEAKRSLLDHFFTTSQLTTDMGDGPVFYDNLVEVSAAD